MRPENKPENKVENQTKDQTRVRINTYDPDDHDTYLLPYDDDAYYDDVEYVQGLSRSQRKGH